MYKDFFGFSDYPFNLTPDPKFIVYTEGFDELLAGLYYGIEMNKGLLVLTGEVGTGKTTAIRWILQRLDATVLAAYICNPRITMEDFYDFVATAFNITGWRNKSELLMKLSELLNERFKRGLKTLLIVDEAHQLPDDLLEEIRLLLNYESSSAKHLQVILSGQPELRDKLNQSSLRQLKQRIAVRCEMPVLRNVSEVRTFLHERLRIANGKQEIFLDDSLDLIFQASEGIPRLINNICDNALLYAYSKGNKYVDRETILLAVKNLDLLPGKNMYQASIQAESMVVAAPTLNDEGMSILAGENNAAGNTKSTDNQDDRVVKWDATFGKPR
jgi:general secretion pathway protein A